MYGKSFELWCCAFLFFASSTNPVRNFTIDNKQKNNSMVRNDLYANFTQKNDNETVFNRYSLHKSFTMDYENVQDVFRTNSESNGRKDDDSIQNEFSMNYMKYHEKRNQILREIGTNLTKIDDEKHSNNENDHKNYSVPYETCDNKTCIHLCCSLGNRYVSFFNCTNEGSEYVSSDAYSFWSETNMQTEYKKVDEMFQLIVENPCINSTEVVPMRLSDDSIEYYKYIFFKNGTLYLPYFDQFIESTSYCLTFSNQDQVVAVICSKALTEAAKKEVVYFISSLKPTIDGMHIFTVISAIVSILCTLIICLVYYILPELHNIHSFMLRRYSSLLFIVYMNNILIMLIKRENLAHPICITSGIISYFSSVASSFWSSIISFDMWWTFRNFHSLTKKVEQQDRKKFIYSIIAWGSSLILTIICIIMEIVPSVPKNMIRPRFDDFTCWFRFGAPDRLYNFGPKSICIVISIFLSIRTALKIAHYEKDTTRRLRDSESRCYNENKKWANLYLKLFIMSFVILAIEWIIMTTWEFWLSKKVKLATMYTTLSICILRTIKDIGIFILFVCKKTIMQLLLKYFRQNRQYVLTISTRRNCYNLEDVNQHVKHNYSIEKYRQSERMEKLFIQ